MKGVCGAPRGSRWPAWSARGSGAGQPCLGRRPGVQPTPAPNCLLCDDTQAHFSFLITGSPQSKNMLDLKEEICQRWLLRKTTQ